MCAQAMSEGRRRLLSSRGSRAEDEDEEEEQHHAGRVEERTPGGRVGGAG